jgi:hypothetical protein
VEVIRRGNSVVGGRASVGRLGEDEMRNQARHLGGSHFSFPEAGNESGQCWLSSHVVRVCTAKIVAGGSLKVKCGQDSALGSG